MVRAVVERRLHVHRLKAGEMAVQQRFADSLLHRRNVLLWHDAALDSVGELEAGAARPRLDLDPGVAELAPTAGLLLQPTLRLGAALDRLLVGHLRRLELDLDPVLALQLLDD